ncbi:CopG family transcriptional regulator [Caldanaerobacter subterraneus KAk]|uniref:CopG family transcriptional regulator n=1 Tax=Caldanaerobacter subterraneus TaxID=911092 RepID=UPI0032C141D6
MSKNRQKAEMQNITSSLPKDLLQKIKHIAIDKQTTVSGLLTETLEEIARKEDLYAKAMLRHISMLEKGFDLGTEGKITWGREELYERQ